jgi:transcription initiation factor TFIIIB Brf1 subunit/transcription initiation factor TFIIB
MKCPKCGFVNSANTEECLKCGIVFKKYQAVDNPDFKKKGTLKDSDGERTGVNLSNIELNAEGVNGQIELFSNKICIRRKGVLSFLTQGLKGDKNIMMSSISSIQFKKAGMLTNGYIQFAFMGGKESKGGLFQGVSDENTVIFNIKQQPLFEQIRDAVENYLQTGNNPASKTSDADELAKLADLRDKGILSEDEFQHKKKQILGL